MNRFLLFIAALIVSSISAYSQVNSYFVYFKNKDGTPYTIDAPENFLTQRSIDRRQDQKIGIEEEDLPVSPIYSEELASIGSVDVRYTSRWFNGALIKATSVDAETIKLLSFVENIEFVAPPNVGGRVADRGSFEADVMPPSDTLLQFSLLGINEMRQDGIDGEGKLVAVIDGGFQGVSTASSFQHLFDNNQVIDTYDFISKTTDVYQYSNHGTSVLSLMAASKTEPQYEGIIPGASYLLYISENAASDVEYRIEEYWWLVAAERADSLGVDVINTSLGYYDFIDPSMNYNQSDLDGNTAIITKAAQKAADRGIVFVTSGGNTATKPWGTITFPSDVFDGLAVGSIIDENRISGFSAKGPTSDGRIKPDLVAVGSGTYVISEDDRVVGKSGTSFASPQVAALAAAIWQAYPTLSSKEIVDAIRQSSNNAINPNNTFGYGIPSYKALVNYIEHFDTESWASIYPNPAIDDLTVYVNDPSDDNIVEFNLYNTNGQPILRDNLEITWQNNRYILDVSTLPRGIYVLNLQSSNNFSQLKFAKL